MSMYHCCVDIRGALRSRHLRRILTVNGKTTTDDELIAALAILQAQGHQVAPVKGCDNFDPQKGCLGHPVEQESAT